MRYIEVELRNDFDFIFSENGEWYKAYCFADNSEFDYDPRGTPRSGFEWHQRLLKKNHEYELIGRVTYIPEYDPDAVYPIDDEEDIYGNDVVRIMFKTNEHGDIDTESVEHCTY